MPAKNKPASTNMLSDPRAGFQVHLWKKYVNAYFVRFYDYSLLRRRFRQAIRTAGWWRCHCLLMMAHPVSAYFGNSWDAEAVKKSTGKAKTLSGEGKNAVLGMVKSIFSQPRCPRPRDFSL
jgi:hypothetical protein